MLLSYFRMSRMQTPIAKLREAIALEDGSRLTQPMLAHIIGAQNPALSEWESGKRFPANAAHAIKWAKALNISLSELADLLRAGYNPRIYRSADEAKKLAGALAPLKRLPLRDEDYCKNPRSYRDRPDKSPMYKLRAERRWVEAYPIACISCSMTAYRNWEKGSYLPEVLYLVKAAELFEVDPEWLYGELSQYKHDYFDYRTDKKGGLQDVAA